MTGKYFDVSADEFHILDVFCPKASFLAFQRFLPRPNPEMAMSTSQRFPKSSHYEIPRIQTYTVSYERFAGSLTPMRHLCDGSQNVHFFLYKGHNFDGQISTFLGTGKSKIKDFTCYRTSRP